MSSLAAEPAMSRLLLLLGDHFDVRAFHDAVLGRGARSLVSMEADVQQWVRAASRAPANNHEERLGR